MKYNKSITEKKKNAFKNIIKPKLIVLGNSNVGKSSFIKFLIKNKKLTTGIVGKTPGTTKSIEKYTIPTLPFEIIDLPGFGEFSTLSKVEKEKSKIKIIEYVENNRKNIFLSILILNAIRINDELQKWYYENKNTIPLSCEFVSWLKELKIDTIILINKIDKLKKSEVILIEEKYITVLKELGIIDKNFINNNEIKNDPIIRSVSLKYNLNLNGLKNIIFQKFEFYKNKNSK